MKMKIFLLTSVFVIFKNSISDLKFTYKLGESKYTVSQNGQSLYIAGKIKQYFWKYIAIPLLWV